MTFSKPHLSTSNKQCELMVLRGHKKGHLLKVELSQKSISW